MLQRGFKNVIEISEKQIIFAPLRSKKRQHMPNTRREEQMRKQEGASEKCTRWSLRGSLLEEKMSIINARERIRTREAFRARRGR